jgi:hypothetical protein
VHSAGTTTWTLPSSLSSTGYTRGVTEEGMEPPLTAITLTPGASSTVTVSGNYASDPMVIGRAMDMQVTLSRPFERDDQGVANLATTLLQRQMVVQHSNESDGFSVVYTPQVGSATTISYTPPTAFEQYGELVAWGPGDMSRWGSQITSSSGLPVTITSIERRGDFVDLSQ